MRRFVPFLALFGALAFGDVAFFWEEIYAELKKADQLAFIYFEKSNETLILSVNFEGKAGNFVWVIPLPSLPKVSLAPKEFFQSLGGLLALLRHPAYHWGPGMGIPGGGGETVRIISREIIGNYDVAILTSTDPSALYRWFEREGYKLPPKAPEVFKPYIERKWFFVAVKITPVKKWKRKPVEGQLTPLKLEFNSRAIVYPLKLSSIEREYVDPKISKIDAWAGHKVVFEKEWESIANQIIKQAKEERRKAIPFKKTLLHKLGFDELQKPYEKTFRGEMEPGDFEALLDMAINDILEDVAWKETSGLELIIVAPYLVKPGAETPAEVSEKLQVSFTTSLEPKIFKTYFLDEKKKPLFSPSVTMYLTHISGRIPFSLFTGDLYLVKK